MNLTQEKALFHLTGKVSLGDVPTEELKTFADTHPYFAPAQFLLASKLKQEKKTEAAAQVAKTALYFTNLSWLQFLFSSGLNRTGIPGKSPLAVPTLETVKEIIQGIDPKQDPEKKTGEAAHEETETGTESPEVPADAAAGKIATLLSGQLADFKKPVEADSRLDIDAARLHTIDYFASQGIRIDLSSIPQDKLTTQLRKFTDWLKQMKSPTEPADLGTGADIENAVMLIAQNSNQSREVVTETMAEVLAKQGQVDKAIQLYIKLSFLNPEKSAYFAARIQHLKGI